MKQLTCILIIVCCSLLTACASRDKSVNVGSLEGLQDLNVKRAQAQHAKAMNEIRFDALRDTAITLGAQAGLAFQSKQINVSLKNNKRQLDLSFNFDALMLDNYVLPPVLSEAQNILKQSDNDTIRLADKTYAIEQQARFVTVPPTWHDYLYMNYPPPQLPDSTLLPSSKDEQKIWDEYVTKGWRSGIKQANDIYSANLGRLKHDMKGMILYRKLLAQHMVSKPYVARSELGITGGGSKVNINDTILRITAKPQLSGNAKQWQPVITR